MMVITATATMSHCHALTIMKTTAEHMTALVFQRAIYSST